MLEVGAESRVLRHERRERGLRLPAAAIDHDFAAPVQSKIGPGTRKIREIPANADVAQLVEHFTRNEGVRGSSPRVGLAQYLPAKRDVRPATSDAVFCPRRR